MEIIVDIRRRKVTKSWCESWHYVTRPSNDVNIFVPNCKGGGESNKMHQGENYQDLLKWGGGCVFWAFSYN